MSKFGLGAFDEVPGGVAGEADVLGMGSATWEEHLPLIEQIAGRFELAE